MILVCTLLETHTLLLSIMDLAHCKLHVAIAFIINGLTLSMYRDVLFVESFTLLRFGVNWTPG